MGLKNNLLNPTPPTQRPYFTKIHYQQTHLYLTKMENKRRKLNEIDKFL